MESRLDGKAGATEPEEGRPLPRLKIEPCYLKSADSEG
jgi:hypothetical protein